MWSPSDPLLKMPAQDASARPPMECALREKSMKLAPSGADPRDFDVLRFSGMLLPVWPPRCSRPRWSLQGGFPAMASRAFVCIDMSANFTRCRLLGDGDVEGPPACVVVHSCGVAHRPRAGIGRLRF